VSSNAIFGNKKPTTFGGGVMFELNIFQERIAGHVILGHDVGHSFLACCFLAGLLFPANTAEEDSKQIDRNEKNTFFILLKFDVI
jgi:hypothetical protein